MLAKLSEDCLGISNGDSEEAIRHVEPKERSGGTS